METRAAKALLAPVDHPDLLPPPWTQADAAALLERYHAALDACNGRLITAAE